MFVSHYDSTSGRPGAADDMVAVSSMLEAMRVQAQNSTLKNDLYFLFTDGEEDGLLGAWRFVDSHPELRDKIGMVMNLEARGNRGGLLLFETSPKAYSLLEAVKKSDASLTGFSWAAAVYTKMPNATDLTAFLREGYKGINLAVGEGVETYHQLTDSYDNLHRSTAWQYLSVTLALADYAAKKPIDNLSAPSEEAVFFPLLPGFMVLMNYSESHIICAVVCALAVIYMVAQAKNKLLKVSFSTILMGSLVLLSVGSAVFFTPGNYLFYMPLFLMTLTALFKKWEIAYIGVRVVSSIVTLLLWVPVVFLLWVSLVQPMML